MNHIPRNFEVINMMAEILTFCDNMSAHTHHTTLCQQDKKIFCTAIYTIMPAVPLKKRALERKGRRMQFFFSWIDRVI